MYYAIGRIRALESLLLTAAQIVRLESAQSFEEAFKVLQETAYAEEMRMLESPFDFEELFHSGMTRLDLLMKQLVSEAGKASSSPLLIALAKHKADLYNLKALIRAQAAKKEEAFFKSRIIGEGYISKEKLFSLFHKNPQEILNDLKYTPYLPALSGGLEHYLKTGEAHLFEKQADDFILKMFHRAKYLAHGPEPVIGYYLAKEAELKTIRFILAAKKSKVEAEKIKERVRNAW